MGGSSQRPSRSMPRRTPVNLFAQHLNPPGKSTVPVNTGHTAETVAACARPRWGCGLRTDTATE